MITRRVWVIFGTDLCVRRQGFGRQSNKANGNGNGNVSQQKGNGTQNSSPTTYIPTMPPLTTSASFSSTLGPNSENNFTNSDNQSDAEPTKFFFREKYARLGVKGNFMPLAAQPKNVDLGEWLAHQGPCWICICHNLSLTRILKLSSSIGSSKLCFNAFRR